MRFDLKSWQYNICRFFMITESLLSLGAIVGVAIGSMIAVVVFVGIAGAALRKQICEPRYHLTKRS